MNLSLAEVDLGRLVLSFAIIVGFLLVFLTLVRSIEIPIRIYMDKRKDNQSNGTTKSSNSSSEKGF
tara:strand:+ start:52 stop:249 length:198 start_codon:yes stop_codon:yes gene_type:complete